MWPLQNPETNPHTWYKFNSIFDEKERVLIEDLKNNQRSKLGHGVVANNTLNRDIRRSKVSFIEVNQETEWLYHKVTHLINTINNSNYNFILDSIYPLQYGVYESKDEGFYDWHQDASFQSNRYKLIRKLSFSILMSKKTDFEGGNLVFNFGGPHQSDYESVELDQYDILFFPSYYSHKVETVTSGTRESIVGWVAGPVWQ